MSKRSFYFLFFFLAIFFSNSLFANNIKNNTGIRGIKNAHVSPLYFIPNVLIGGKGSNSNYILRNTPEVKAFLQCMNGRIYFSYGGMTMLLPSEEKTLGKSASEMYSEKKGNTELVNRISEASQCNLMLMECGFLRANENKNPTEIILEEPTGAYANFLIGDKSNWKSKIPMYRTLRYKNVWDGIDVTYHGYMNKLEYRINITPNSDPSQIVMQTGANRVCIGKDGSLIAEYEGGRLIMSPPKAWQEIDGNRVSVNVSFKVLEEGLFSFDLPEYNTNYPLTIDPIIKWATYVGGSGDGRDTGNGIDVDSSGSAYVVGKTGSVDFPVTDGAYDNTFNGTSTDAFVVKFSPDGSSVLYSTFIGGSKNDVANCIKVDSTGSAYIGGETHSDDFPITSGAFDKDYKNTEGFIVKLSPDGSTLIYSTFIGGVFYDTVNAICLDSANSAIVTGSTVSNDFPTTDGVFDDTFNGSYDVFISKISPDGDSLDFSTLLGGTSSEIVNTVKIDSSGNIYVAGNTTSDDFPVSGALFSTLQGNPNVFVSKLSGDGTTLLYSTYLGGTKRDYCYGLDIGADNSIYLAGVTYSNDFPATSGSLNGSSDGFLTKISSDGQALIYSTFIGGSDSDSCYDVKVDATGAAYIVGETNSEDFPTTSGVWGENRSGGVDCFISKVAPDGSSFVYSTFLGDIGGDYGRAIALDSNGNTYVTGFTYSDNFPVTAGVWKDTNNNGANVFVTKLSDDGSSLVYSTTFGGSGGGEDSSYLAVGSDGTIFVAGYTASPDFPTTAEAYDEQIESGYDGFILALSEDGSTLIYSTFLGGDGADKIYDIAVDSSGEVYVTGETGSENFPTTVNAFQTTKSSLNDVFVTKLSGDGSTLEYSTYLGGSSRDCGTGIAIDSDGHALVSGFTFSPDLPVTSDAIQNSKAGGHDFFLGKFSSDGSTLSYLTYIGGTKDEYRPKVAVDSDGNCYLAGYTYSEDFPTTSGVYSTENNGSSDACYLKIASDGSLVYSGYIGGGGAESVCGIYLDNNRNLYICGYTTSNDYPTSTSAFATTYGGSYDGFLSKISPDGSTLSASTYVGGSSDDKCYGIVAGSDGSVYCTGETFSSDFPITPDAMDKIRSSYEAFLTKLNYDFSTLEYSTYVGGTGGGEGIRDRGRDIALGLDNNVIITGYTDSDSFPTTSGAYDGTFNGSYDIFVAKIVFPTSRAYFPRMYYKQGEWTEGYAFANPEGENPSDIWFASYDSDGNMLRLSQVYTLNGIQQVAYQSEVIFNWEADIDGWVEVEFNNENSHIVPGFFLTQEYSNGLVGLDGAACFYNPIVVGVIPRVINTSGFTTKVYIANPTFNDVNVNLMGYDDTDSYDGGSVAIPAKGVYSFNLSDVFTEHFNGALKITSDGEGIVANAIISYGTDSIASMNLIPESEASTTLYAAHITLMPDVFYTDIGLFNTESGTANVTLTPYNADGTPMSSPIQFTIESYRTKELSDEELGLPSGVNSDGWLKVISDKKLIGYLTFGNPSDNHYSSTLPLQGTGKNHFIFAQVANGNVGGVDYFTGITIVNPNATSTDVTIRVMDSSGTIVGEVTRTLAPKEKYVRMVDQIEGIGTLPYMNSGILEIIATQNVFAFELFGDVPLNFLSAVPGQ